MKTYTHITFHEHADSYLGMTVEVSADKSTIKLSQKGMLSKLVDTYLSDKRERSAATPAENNLFDTSVDDRPLSEKDRKTLLSCVMALMYLARLTRPDILLAVTFLASRVHCATEGDKNKMMRILKYLKGSTQKKVIINCKDFAMKSYCDASYGTHNDGKSHTGYLYTIGDSYLHARSFKQKLSALSSTDAEIFAATSATSTGVWLMALHNEIFMTTIPKYIVQHIILYQDNQSGLWMITKPSKHKRSKHILTKLSYLKDMYALGLIQPQYLPTEQMKGDGLTKPTQGTKFANNISDMVK